MLNMKSRPILHEDGVSYLLDIGDGFTARFDADDLALVMQYIWRPKRGSSSGVYARTSRQRNGVRKIFGMHRLVTNWWARYAGKSLGYFKTQGDAIAAVQKKRGSR